MSTIGTNDASITPGAWTPTRATIGPITAAREYAGEVAFSPIARASTNPIAFGLSVAGAADVRGVSSTMVPHWCTVNGA